MYDAGHQDAVISIWLHEGFLMVRADQHEYMPTWQVMFILPNGDLVYKVLSFPSDADGFHFTDEWDSEYDGHLKHLIIEGYIAHLAEKAILERA